MVGEENTKITYKGITHVFVSTARTMCGITIPFKGKHLYSISEVDDVGEITCKKCITSLKYVLKEGE